MIDPSTHWRDSARPAKFFIVSAHIIWPALIFLMNITFRTTLLLVGSFVFLFVLEKNNFTITKLIRYTKVFIVGKVRYRKGSWQ
jgi:intracellular multiplication protein IcmT